MEPQTTLQAQIQIQIEMLPHGIMPTYCTSGSAGADVYSATDGTIMPRERSELIPTGIKMKIPDSFYCEIKPRSGLALRYGIDVLAGVIDSDYRNEVFVILQNNGNAEFMFSRGDRIAQLIFKQYLRAEFAVVEQLDTTERTGGFGSTGQ